MPNPMSKKVALVTGGARGIGRAIALDLGRDHHLAITHLHSAPNGLPEDALCIKADLSDAASHTKVISAIIERFGRLDVLVNNAGVIAPSPLEGADPDALRNIFDVNVLAPHGLLAAALPHLGAGAAVVGISSVNAVLPPKGAALYGASKAALDLWTKAMAKELGPRGIRVNAVAPGPIWTPLIPASFSADEVENFGASSPMGRAGQPDEVAPSYIFLASNDASYMTGQVLHPNGGTVIGG